MIQGPISSPYAKSSSRGAEVLRSSLAQRKGAFASFFFKGRTKFLEADLVISYRIKHASTQWPIISQLGIYIWKMKTYIHTHV
jgi:hypothetical protein